MPTSPMELSLRVLRQAGFCACPVETWAYMPDPQKRTWQGRRLFILTVRRDFAGFGDIIAFGQGKPALIVQTTTVDHQANRFRKLSALPEARAWLEDGNRIIVHGWRKDEAINRWVVTRRNVTLEHMEKQK